MHANAIQTYYNIDRKNYANGRCLHLVFPFSLFMLHCIFYKNYCNMFALCRCFYCKVCGSESIIALTTNHCQFCHPIVKEVDKSIVDGIARTRWDSHGETTGGVVKRREKKEGEEARTMKSKVVRRESRIQFIWYFVHSPA